MPYVAKKLFTEVIAGGIIPKGFTYSGSAADLPVSNDVNDTVSTTWQFVLVAAL